MNAQLATILVVPIQNAVIHMVRIFVHATMGLSTMVKTIAVLVRANFSIYLGITIIGV